MILKRLENWVRSPSIFRVYPHLKYVLGVLVLIGALSPYVHSILIACFLAYVMIPIVWFLRCTLRIPKMIAVLGFLTILGIVSGVFLVRYVPILIRDIQEILQHQFPMFWDRVQVFLKEQDIPGSQLLLNAIESWRQEFQGMWDLEQIFQGIQPVWERSWNAFAKLIHVILIPVFVILLYAYHDVLGNFARQCFPKTMQHRLEEFVRLSHITMIHYFRGLFFVMICLAVCYSVSLTLLDVQYGVAIGIFSGLAIVVPYLGLSMSALIAMVSVFLSFTHWSQPLGVLLCYGLFPMLDSFILSPTFIGASVGMPAGMILIVLLIGGTWFGVLGALFAVPVALLLKLFWVYQKDAHELETIVEKIGN